MQRADYSSPAVVKGLLYDYDNIMRLGIKGDGVALSVCVDLKTAIHTEGVLTFKQKRYLGWWWQGYSYTEIAARYHLNPSTTKRGVDLAAKRISKYLHGKMQD